MALGVNLCGRIVVHCFVWGMEQAAGTQTNVYFAYTSVTPSVAREWGTHDAAKLPIKLTRNLLAI